MACPYIYAAHIANKGSALIRESACFKERCELYCNFCKRCGLVCYCVGMRIKIMREMEKDIDD